MIKGHSLKQEAGNHGAVLVVTSLPDGGPFETYEAAAIECARRNLRLAIERGHADAQMPALDGGKGGLAPYTYREFYSGRIAGR